MIKKKNYNIPKCTRYMCVPKTYAYNVYMNIIIIIIITTLIKLYE